MQEGELNLLVVRRKVRRDHRDCIGILSRIIKGL